MRRRFMLVLGLALLAAACADSEDRLQATAAACAPGETDGDLSLYVPEPLDPNLIGDFQDRYGAGINEAVYDSNETMRAEVEAGEVVYDLVVPADYMIEIMRNEGLLLTLNKGALPNLANLAAMFASGLPFDPAAEFSVPYQWGTIGIGYNSQSVDLADGVSWGLIFDHEASAEYAGQISMLNDDRQSLGAALKYLGFSVNTTQQAEIETASALLREAGARIATFDSEHYDDLLVAGEVAIAHGSNDTFFRSYNENGAWDENGYAIPREGGVIWVTNMAVPTVAGHPCTAHTFINFLLDAENGAALANWSFYASPNEASTEHIDPEILEDPAIYPPVEMLTDGSLEFLAPVGDFAMTYTDAFTEAKS